VERGAGGARSVKGGVTYFDSRAQMGGTRHGSTSTLEKGREEGGGRARRQTSFGLGKVTSLTPGSTEKAAHDGKGRFLAAGGKRKGTTQSSKREVNGRKHWQRTKKGKVLTPQ